MTYHTTRRKSQTDEERFWSKVAKASPDECWEWQGYIAHDGYGGIKIGRVHDNSRRYIRAHRFSYELNKGPIKDGKFVCHSCDNPSCVNPAHLFLGTNQDNISDMISKGRQARGTGHGRVKLSIDDVRRIRNMAAKGMLQREIASVFKINRSAVSMIVNGKRWSHIK